MYVPPKDSRLRYTKQCLFDSFLKALAEKPLTSISVIEICEDAGVSRKTFYKYYSNPYALLVAMQDDLFHGFRNELTGLPPNIYEITPELLRFASQHRVLVRAILENRGEGNLIDRMIDALYGVYRQDWQFVNPGMSEQDAHFFFHYVVSGLVGVLSLWLLQYPQMTVDEVIIKADYLMRLSTPTASAKR
jgi:AcrR family transcriptional regulator